VDLGVGLEEADVVDAVLGRPLAPRVSIADDRSTPRAVAADAARAASRVVWPLPQPMLSTRSAGMIAAASAKRWR
jgi:hypothetical protein